MDNAVPGIIKRSYQDSTYPVTAVSGFERLEINTAGLAVLMEFARFTLHEDIARLG
jgi:hypothetical protein